MQKLLLSMSLFTCYLRLLPNVVLYRSGGGELIPWCPEVVLYIIQPVIDLDLRIFGYGIVIILTIRVPYYNQGRR